MEESMWLSRVLLIWNSLLRVCCWSLLLLIILCISINSVNMYVFLCIADDALEDSKASTGSGLLQGSRTWEHSIEWGQSQSSRCYHKIESYSFNIDSFYACLHFPFLWRAFDSCCWSLLSWSLFYRCLTLLFCFDIRNKWGSIAMLLIYDL